MAIEVAVVWGSKQGSSRDPGYLSGVITTSLAFCCPHWFFHQVICQSPPFISWAEIPRSAGNPFTLLQKSCCIDSSIWFWSQIEIRLLPLLAWVIIALCSWRKFIYCAVCFLKSLVICFCPLLKESRWSPGQDPEVMRCWWGKQHPEKWIFIRPFPWQWWQYGCAWSDGSLFPYGLTGVGWFPLGDLSIPEGGMCLCLAAHIHLMK